MPPLLLLCNLVQHFADPVVPLLVLRVFAPCARLPGAFKWDGPVVKILGQARVAGRELERICAKELEKRVPLGRVLSRHIVGEKEAGVLRDPVQRKVDGLFGASKHPRFACGGEQTVPNRAGEAEC